MRFLAALLLCVVGLSGSTLQVRGTSEPLPHDAYVWQRVWTPGVVAAAQESADIVRAWRIGARVVHVALFARVPAGEYVVWHDESTPAGTVVVRGGEVAHYRLT